MTIKQVCKLAKDNLHSIAYASQDSMNQMLDVASKALIASSAYIISENHKDIQASDKPANIIDRLTLNDKRIEDIAKGLFKLKQLDCPVGEVLDDYTIENGLNIKKVRVPLGVIGIIYEARPNVTADAIGLAIKSGNAIVLRGSSDAIKSNIAIIKVIKDAITSIGVNAEFIQLIEDTTRQGAAEFMQMNGLIDVLIPRGSAGLIASAVKNSTVPVIETGSGNCHIYIEKSADLNKALPIILNAKLQRNSVCNAVESLLIDKSIVEKALPNIIKALKENDVKMKVSSDLLFLDKDLQLATEEDYGIEFLSNTISIKSVENVNEAIEHINNYSTKHSDSIITENKVNADLFLQKVDSAAVYVNASTRFTDGFEFGFGAEMGISTQKLHARGPLGLKELCSYKYQIMGSGQIRK